MTKGTRAFRIIISILLAITMLWTAYISYAFIYITKENNQIRRDERYGIYVAGIDVTWGNCHDILGDGTASYNYVSNILTLKNATIACEGSAIYSQRDLTVELIGENTFICSGRDLTYALYAADRSLKKDLAIRGDGTLKILVEDDTCKTNAGIIAENVWISSDVSITLANAAEGSKGINCGDLTLDDDRILSVQVGSAENSTGIFTRGSIHLSEGSVLKVVGAAAAKESFAIECTETFTASENVTIYAESGGDRAGIVCYSVFLNYGADIESEIDAINGIRNMKEN